MSKRGSRNAEFLSRKIFDSNRESVKKENIKTTIELTNKKISTKLNSNEILSTTQPLRGKKKPIEKIIPLEGNVIPRRPADSGQPELISNSDNTSKKIRGTRIKKSKVNFYKNKRQKITSGKMVNSDRLGRPTRKEREEGSLEKTLPFD